MTYDVSNIHAPTGASRSLPPRHGVSGPQPLMAWQAIRRAARFVSDVVSEAGQLRRKLRRQHPTTEE